MTLPALLDDKQLQQRCWFWRIEAVQGTRGARKAAHAYEAELARRLCDETTVCGLLERTPLQRRAFWRFW